jgi:hypothetical protein
VSYHETYEFFALDRCLTVAHMRALRRISTRATITPNRFFNWYDWGGLKGDPHDMLGRYFDLFVHTGNGVPDWGMLRFPVRAITLASWRPYVAVPRGRTAPSSAASLVVQGKVAVLSMTPAPDPSLAAIDDDEFQHSNEGLRDDESVDQASWPVPLALMRARLLSGDLSPLYLLWLLSVQYGDRRAAAAEPARPPAFDRLDGALHLFAEFLGLNAHLMKVALEGPRAAPRTAGQLLRAAHAYETAARRAGRTRSTDS